jgi:hypothetical protein
MTTQHPEISAYFAKMGRKGGQTSRRTLTPSEAKNMVRIREARHAFKNYYSRCFWYMPSDLVVAPSDIPEIARGLRTNGGREGFLLAARLCP